MGARAYNLVVPMGQSGGLYPGIAALYNDQPGVRVDVRRVDVLPPGGQTLLGVGRMEVQRFWAPYPSGDFALVPGVKLDTNDPDTALAGFVRPAFEPYIPPDTITRLADFPAGSSTAALAPMSTRQTLGGCGRGGLRNSALLACRAASDVEPVRLVFAGHAICLVQTQSGLPHAGRVEAVVQNVGTGATYLYSARVNTGVADPLRPLFALWSGGDTWDVKRFDWIVDAQATPLAGLRLVKMEGDHTSDLGVQGDPITPAPHDSLFPCPEGIRGVAGALRGAPFGRSTGVPYDYDTTHGAAGWTVVSQLQAGRLRRVVRPTPGAEAGSTLSPMMVGAQVVFDGSRAPITLRYQQSLVLCDGVGADVLPSTFAAGEVSIEFTVSDDSPDSSGVSYVS